MTRVLRKAALAAPLPLALVLSACGGAVPATRPPGRLPAPQPRPAPTVQVARGLEGVIGADAEALLRQFGPARLDVHEEDARKLQWSGAACILDVYLYPPQAGGVRPTATYVDARRGDGREVDRAACVAALKRP